MPCSWRHAQQTWISVDSEWLLVIFKHTLHWLQLPQLTLHVPCKILISDWVYVVDIFREQNKWHMFKESIFFKRKKSFKMSHFYFLYLFVMYLQPVFILFNFLHAGLNRNWLRCIYFQDISILLILASFKEIYNLTRAYKKNNFKNTCLVMYRTKVPSLVSTFFVYRKYRHVSYRQVVRWCYGYLGRHNRVPLHSCIMHKTRATFPDPDGNYVGFRYPDLDERWFFFRLTLTQA